MSMDNAMFEELKAEFEAEQQQAQAQEPPIEEPTETVTSEAVASPETQEDPQQEVVQQEQTPVEGDLQQQETKQRQSPETNAKFAEMRNQAKELQKYKEFLDRVSTDNGVPVEKLMEEYQRQQVQREAEKQGVPVEIMQRLQTLEQENKRVQTDLHNERLHGQVNALKTQMNLTDEDVEQVFSFIGEKGYFNPTTQSPIMSLQDAYFLANKDSLVEKMAQEKYQKELEMKKQRQTQAAVPHGGGQTPDTSSKDWTNEEIDKQLEKMGLRPR